MVGLGFMHLGNVFFMHLGFVVVIAPTEQRRRRLCHPSQDIPDLVAQAVHLIRGQEH